ncbi:sugar phosphate isomerase/epimerase [Thalassotalea ponticola]|uniref:sugar phosphate isomerase/epimerase family protein n=1 Tax=Thalassotalea ponticola TaxID=1523392 RepID=UPI0025B57F1E|nr:sugar phosphate isomerase/epimerase [Thalassotalea ponticola]MDN3652628.1 sugar phosphate isomerase/epimerase [Thalassotalea ponticola]
MTAIRHLLLSAITVMTLAVFTLANATMKPHINTSLQLWSVKNELKSDFKTTLSHIAELGFDGVEFAGEFGSYNNDAKGLKALLDDLGLKVSGAHVPLEQLTGERFELLVEFYQILETPVLIIPIHQSAYQADTVDRFISTLQSLSTKLKAYNMRLGYHNHWQEFEPFNQITYWDHIAQSTTSDIVLQLDIGWVAYAGKDPVQYIKRYPKRTFTAHYKAKPTGVQFNKVKVSQATPNYQGKPLIGQDEINWAEVLHAHLSVGGGQWVVVEQEEYPANLTPLQAVAVSKNALDKLIKSL